MSCRICIINSINSGRGQKDHTDVGILQTMASGIPPHLGLRASMYVGCLYTIYHTVYNYHILYPIYHIRTLAFLFSLESLFKALSHTQSSTWVQLGRPGGQRSQLIREALHASPLLPKNGVSSNRLTQKAGFQLPSWGHMQNHTGS